MLTYRVEPLPAMWPGVRTLSHQRKRSPQYQGFKALPAGATSPAVLSISEAIKILSEYSGRSFGLMVAAGDDAVAREAVRIARARTHPDVPGGSADAFHEVQAAAARIGEYIGTAL